MIGILLAGLSGVFIELSTAIGKYEEKRRKESIYAMGFIWTIWGLVGFGVWGLVTHDFRFSAASLPTLALRAVLEVLQLYFTLKAVTSASRTTNTLFSSLTIPLLLAADLFLGYSVTNLQIIGMTVIVLCLFVMALNHGIGKKGLAYVILASVNAVSTLSLYKYDITHYNSVPAEQFAVFSVLMVWLLWNLRTVTKERPLKLLMKPMLAGQSAAYGIGAIVGSFAYAFAPASVILASFRSFMAMASLATGKIVFHEDHVLLKALAVVVCMFGIVLLTM